MMKQQLLFVLLVIVMTILCFTITTTTAAMVGGTLAVLTAGGQPTGLTFEAVGSGASELLPVYLYLYVWKKSDWQTIPVKVSALTESFDGPNPYSNGTIAFSSQRPVHTFNFLETFVDAEYLFAAIYPAELTLASQSTLDAISVTGWAGLNPLPEMPIPKIQHVNVVTNRTAFVVEPYAEFDRYIITTMTSPPYAQDGTNTGSVVADDTFVIFPEVQQATFHQSVTRCFTTYLDLDPPTRPIAIVENTPYTNPDYTTPGNPRFYLHHSDFSSASAYDTKCYLGVRPFHAPTAEVETTATYQLSILYGATRPQPIGITTPTIVVENLPVPPTFTAIGHDYVCSAIDTTSLTYTSQELIHLYPGDVFFFGVNPIDNLTSADHPGHWSFYNASKSDIQVSGSFQQLFQAESDDTGLKLTYVGTDTLQIPPNTAITTTWGNNLWEMDVIPQRYGKDRDNNLYGLIVTPSIGFVYAISSIGPTKEQFWSCDPVPYAMRWSTVHDTFHQMELSFPLVTADIVTNMKENTKIQTGGFVLSLVTQNSTRLGFGLGATNYTHFMAQIASNSNNNNNAGHGDDKNDFGEINCNFFAQGQNLKRDAFGYDLGHPSLHFIQQFPTDLLANSTDKYANTLLNFRISCIFSPHPQIPALIWDHISAGYEAFGGYDWSLPLLPHDYFPFQHALPRTESVAVEVSVSDLRLQDSRYITTVPITGGRVIRGHAIDFTLTQHFNATQQDVCFFPGTALIFNVSQSMCFQESVVCTTSPEYPQHVMDDRRNNVLSAYGKLQVGIYGGADVNTGSTAYCPTDQVTDDRMAMFSMQCRATISRTLPQGTTCNLSAQTGLPLLDGGNQSRSPLWNIISSGDGRLAEFTLIDEPVFQWRCKMPNTANQWVSCEDQSYIAAVKAQPCAGDPCDCKFPREASCIYTNDTPMASIMSNETMCDVAKPQYSDVIVSTRADCEKCKNSPATLHNWGPRCDLLPVIHFFGYEPVVAAIDNLIDYNNNITFVTKYSGSPFNQITFHAQSSAFSPFKTITITTIPIAMTSPDAQQIHTISFTFAMKNLGFDGDFSDLTFFATVGKNVQSPTTGTDNGSRPILKTAHRCKDLANPDSEEGLCLNGGICQASGKCKCQTSSIFQLGDFCEAAICPTLNCVAEHTVTTGHTCEIVKKNNVDTPQCICQDTTRFAGARCEVETQCSSQPAMATCADPSGFPALNTTTNTCGCECQGSRYTAAHNAKNNKYCQDCNLRCLNNGKDNSNCLASTCTCPSTGSSLFYGKNCECKGVVLKSTLPIDSDRFEFIKTKRAEVALLMQQSTEAASTNNMLSFLQRDSFTLFLNSFLQNILADYRDTLVRTGVDTRELYVRDENGVEQINGQSISKIVELKDFNVVTSPSGDKQATFTMLVVALPQCVDKDRAVDDTHWTETFQHINAVATYLADGEEGEVTPIIELQVFDPTCTNQSCLNEKQNTNAGSNSPPSALFTTIGIIFMMIMIMV